MKSPLRPGRARFDLERVQMRPEQSHPMADLPGSDVKRRQAEATIEPSRKLHELICQLIAAVEERYVTGRPIAKADYDAIYRVITHNRAMLRSGSGKSKNRSI